MQAQVCWKLTILTSTRRSTTSVGIFSMRISMTLKISPLALAKVVVCILCWDWVFAARAVCLCTYKRIDTVDEIAAPHRFIFLGTGLFSTYYRKKFKKSIRTVKTNHSG